LERLFPLLSLEGGNVFDTSIKNPGASQCLNTVFSDFLNPDISVD